MNHSVHAYFLNYYTLFIAFQKNDQRDMELYTYYTKQFSCNSNFYKANRLPSYFGCRLLPQASTPKTAKTDMTKKILRSVPQNTNHADNVSDGRQNRKTLKTPASTGIISQHSMKMGASTNAIG